MKKTLPLILFAAISTVVNAAPLNKKQSNQHAAIYNAILQKQSTSTVAYKATAVQRRILANSYTSNGTLNDSNHYYYSNGRGSTHTNADSYYDNFYATGIYSTNKYILSDSSVNWHVNGAGDMVRTGRNAYTYNTMNQVINHDYKTDYYHLGHAITYNSSGSIATVTASDTFGGTAFIPKSTFYAVYNTMNKRTSDSTVNLQTGNATYKRVYTYDANGNMLRFEAFIDDTGTWAMSYRNINTYDASDRLITSTSETDYTGSGMTYSYKDSFAYTGTSVMPACKVSYNWDAVNSVWKYDNMIYSQYNSQGLLDTYYIMHYSLQWDTIERDIHIYDANGLLLYTNGYLYIGNGQFNTTPYDQSTQYYEDYFPAAIHTTVADNNNISIYPNPTKGIINIHTDDNKEGNVSVFNMDGRLMFNSSGTQLNNRIIDIQQYPAGNYIINISDDSGKQLYRQQFSKL